MVTCWNGIHPPLQLVHLLPKKDVPALKCPWLWTVVCFYVNACDRPGDILRLAKCQLRLTPATPGRTVDYWICLMCTGPGAQEIGGQKIYKKWSRNYFTHTEEEVEEEGDKEEEMLPLWCCSGCRGPNKNDVKKYCFQNCVCRHVLGV